MDRVKYWLSVGAQPSEPFAKLLANVGVLPPPPIRFQTVQQVRSCVIHVCEKVRASTVSESCTCNAFQCTSPHNNFMLTFHRRIRREHARTRACCTAPLLCLPRAVCCYLDLDLFVRVLISAFVAVQIPKAERKAAEAAKRKYSTSSRPAGLGLFQATLGFSPASLSPVFSRVHA